MSVRDHHNPFLRQRRVEDRANRRNARNKPKKQRDFVSTRAQLARDLLDRITFEELPS